MADHAMPKGRKSAMSTYLRRYAGPAMLAAALTLVAAPAALRAQTVTSDAQIIQGLQSVTSDDPGISAALLRQMAQQSIAQNPGIPTQTPNLVQKLNQLAQITVQIQFALNSPIIRPESYATLGSIADAMHHPMLWNYKFLVVGNTDATGTREYNLRLSQERADAIVQALVTLFRVAPNRLEAVGLGQEALQDPSKPDAAVNRRVQIYNIGTVKPMPAAQ
jgi:outer membrane protein OmpA-like peptidoglycan-associated protein